jgi:hypothetical protein
MVDDLSQQLNRRLSTVGLQHRHVDVINKDDHFTAGGGSNEIFFLLHEFVLIHEQVLDVLGVGLGREVEVRRHEYLGVDLDQKFIHDDRFAHPGFPQRQHVETSVDELVDDEAELDGVGSRDQDVEERHVGVVDKFWDDVVPRLELFVLEIDEIVVDVPFERETGEDFEDLGLDELGVLLSGVPGLAVEEVAPH